MGVSSVGHPPWQLDLEQNQQSYAQRSERRTGFFRAFFLIPWGGEIDYVRPFFDGMAAWGSVPGPTPLGKML